MVDVIINTDHFPEDERFERWHEMVARALMPVEIINTGRQAYRSELRIIALGQVQVQAVRSTPCLSVRTAKLVRKSDPEIVHVVIVSRGHAAVEQNRIHASMRPSDLVFYDSSRPSSVEARIGAHGTARGLTATIPRALIPLPPAVLQRWSATTFSAQAGAARLLAKFLSGVANEKNKYGPSDAARLGSIATDLFATSLAGLLNTIDTLPADTRQQALLIEIQNFICQHLRNPDLTPATVATAHHISVRTLHRLFQTEHCTVASWIRQQRLKRCRDDFANPRLRHHSILAIASRWGFTDPAHFSRLFYRTYGLPPREYRALAHGQPS